MACIALDAARLERILKAILPPMLDVAIDSKNDLRLRVKIIIERLLRKCGREVLEVVFPEEHAKLLRSVRRQWQRRTRKKNEEKKANLSAFEHALEGSEDGRDGGSDADAKTGFTSMHTSVNSTKTNGTTVRPPLRHICPFVDSVFVSCLQTYIHSHSQYCFFPGYLGRKQVKMSSAASRKEGTGVTSKAGARSSEKMSKAVSRASLTTNGVSRRKVKDYEAKLVLKDSGDLLGGNISTMLTERELSKKRGRRDELDFDSGSEEEGKGGGYGFGEDGRPIFKESESESEAAEAGSDAADDGEEGEMPARKRQRVSGDDRTVKARKKKALKVKMTTKRGSTQAVLSRASVCPRFVLLARITLPEWFCPSCPFFLPYRVPVLARNSRVRMVGAM